MREKRWLLCFLVAVCCTFSTWALPSQDKTVTLNLQNVSIETVLDAVKKQTGVNMLYNSQMFKGVPPVSINAKNEKWEVALKLILNPQGFDYVVKDGIVVLMPPTLNSFKARRIILIASPRVRPRTTIFAIKES